MMNPTLIRTYGDGNGDYLFDSHGVNYRVQKRGGRVNIEDWVPDPVTPFDTQLVESITRRFFLELELQRQAFLQEIYMGVFA